MANTNTSFLCNEGGSGRKFLTLSGISANGETAVYQLYQSSVAEIEEQSASKSFFMGNSSISTTESQGHTAATKFVRGFFLENLDASNSIFFSSRTGFATSDTDAFELKPGKQIWLPYYSLAKLYFRTSASTAKLQWCGC